MKKWSVFFLCALLTALPLGGVAEDLPQVLGAISQGLHEGLTEGIDVIASAGTQAITAQDLSLSLTAQDARIEEGRTLPLTITAENPYPAAADVTLTLDLPARLTCAQSVSWQAQLAPAGIDPASGELIPSVKTFTREVTLVPGGGVSETADIQVEMGLGARFYRAKTALELCVPLISASASIGDAASALVQPGDTLPLLVDIVNEGAAPKDVAVSLALPDGVSPEGELPAGFALNGRTITGALRVEAGSSAAVSLPLRTEKNLLEGDADASRLIAAVLTVDGERVPTPMIRVVGPMISAKLIPQLDHLEEGEMMDLSITVVNTGLAGADVELCCLLPEGLTIIDAPQKTENAKDTANAKKETPATQDEADDDLPPSMIADDSSEPPAAAAEPVMSEAAVSAFSRDERGALLYTLRMDPATETEGGIAAASKEIRLRVRADVPVENVGDRLLGASLAWRTDEGDMQLSEAAALRVYQQGFMGLDDAEWNGILLAALLMMVTICCLYSAVKSDNKPEEYCFE